MVGAPSLIWRLEGKLTKLRIIPVIVLAMCLSACADDGIVIGPHDPSPLPTAPSTMPELLASLSDSDYRVRLVAVAALRDMGPAAKPSVPALIVTLADNVSDVRVVSAEALGAIGLEASSAAPSLVNALRSDEHGAVRAAAAEALGKIGDACAVPVLAEALWNQEDVSVRIKAAQAMAHLTGSQFPDSEWGAHGYKLAENGEPLLVITAQEWWREEGELQTWENCDS
jgi:HEAT repeat protein